MPRKKPDKPNRSNCNATDSIQLPVVGDGGSRQRMRASKNGPRRAIVLAVVQLLIIAHIVQWAIMGSTVSPIEPSEAMEFSKYGIVNAGLIFFALALLSTLIFGRWFCGWGCHVVLLQDLCGWMMKKVGIRPKPFRSRLLMWVPLLLALYMFIWPAFYRFAILPWRDMQVEPWQVQTHLITEDFWQTFPGLMVAIPFLLICGFATVYFLGAKGFCTYGCPYGGFFAPLDEYSPGRIRVTDDCEQCGHCTAVCTSNVRVHEEVREYGMVVDPGCMKCMDCVSVCPKDALYFGFGKTAAQKGPAKSREPKRAYDLSMREELSFALVFAAMFFAFRGDYANFPLLMAAGVSSVMTFIIWKAWRTLRLPNGALHRFQLRLRGQIKIAGWVLIAGAVLVSLITVHSGAVNAMTAMASWHESHIGASRVAVYAGVGDAPSEAEQRRASKAIWWYDAARQLAGGSRSPMSHWRDGTSMRLAWLHSVTGDLHAAERKLEPLMGRSGASSELWMHAMATVLKAQGDRHDDVVSLYRELLTSPDLVDSRPMLQDFLIWADQMGLTSKALAIVEARLEVHPEDTQTMRWLALLLLDAGRSDEGIALLRQVIEQNPDDEAARALLNRAIGSFAD